MVGATHGEDVLGGDGAGEDVGIHCADAACAEYEDPW